MRTANANHSRLTVGLAAATSIVLIPSLAAASTLPDEGEAVITVVDEGDPNHRVLLSGPLTPGTVADTTTNYDVDMSMVGSGFPIFLDLEAVGAMTRTTEVLSVDKEGAYTARETITSFELTMESGGSSDPEDLDVDGNGTTDLSPLIDVPLVVEYGEDGVLTNAEADSTAATSSVTPEQEELIEGLVEDGWGTEGFAVLMPTIPVGEGAVWTATEATNPASLDLPIALRLTLVSLDGNEYVDRVHDRGRRRRLLRGAGGRGPGGHRRHDADRHDHRRRLQPPRPNALLGSADGHDVRRGRCFVRHGRDHRHRPHVDDALDHRVLATCQTRPQ